MLISCGDILDQADAICVIVWKPEQVYSNLQIPLGIPPLQKVSVYATLASWTPPDERGGFMGGTRGRGMGLLTVPAYRPRSAPGCRHRMGS